ncbi:Transmembrane_domain-containing protein [Hexamita inflata]|uniref:Transmembrane_domain-containing protein n=1 Tax=Hexamita inflata TaxID=28002 RepID=A0ABP1KA24_9EUKA
MLNIRELFSGFHLFSFNLPIQSRCNWAKVVKTRVFVDFSCFMILLWLMYCPDFFIGANSTTSDKVSIVIILVIYLLDTLISFLAVQTMYMNWLVLFIFPVNMLCILVRKSFNDRYRAMISLQLLCVTHVLTFVASSLHIFIIYVFHVNDVQQ